MPSPPTSTLISRRRTADTMGRRSRIVPFTTRSLSSETAYDRDKKDGTDRLLDEPLRQLSRAEPRVFAGARHGGGAIPGLDSAADHQRLPGIVPDVPVSGLQERPPPRADGRRPVRQGDRRDRRAQRDRNVHSDAAERAI